MAEAISSNYRIAPISETFPGNGAFAITPSDTANLPSDIRLLVIGGEGVVKFLGLDNKEYTTGVLPVGPYPIFIRRVFATGTTDTVITGIT